MTRDHARRTNGSQRSRRRWRLAGFTALLALILAACGRGLPQNSLEPAGPIAQEIDGLFQLVFWIAVVVFVLVEGALIYVMIRFRRRTGDETPVQIHGNNRLEILWTIIPALILAALAVPTVSTIFGLAERPKGEVVDIEVVGHQWWWEFNYGDEGIVTANEMHIPIDTPIVLTLSVQETEGGLAGFTETGEPIPESAVPVIHSFWVPRLGGKQDLVPGRIHTMKIQADEPGVYRGQCAEFCGLSHGWMRMRVIAHTKEDYRVWLADEREVAAESQDELIQQGAEFFQNFGTGSCLACHGLQPGQGGTVGPNLANFGSRTTFGAGMFENTEENLRRWLDDPRAMKPGVLMPDYNLTEEQIDALVAYLLSLE
jgi:cytochrome c oxidase subunit II